MSMYQCQACFGYQEEMLDLNNGCGAQVQCFCFTLQELFVQYLIKQNLVVIPDDADLEDAMMELGGGQEVVQISDDVELEDAMMDLGQEVGASCSFDGFDREILADYDSQLYQLPEEDDINTGFPDWLFDDSCDQDYKF